MKRWIVGLVVVLGGVGLAEASVDSFGSGDNQFTIDFVPISGATNPTSGIPAGTGFTFTGVSNDYRMGKFEITNDQWNKFEAAYGTATGDPSDAYDQSSVYTGASVPTDSVSWLEAAQFVNWLNTSTNHSAAYKFTGEQGTGSYTFEVWAPSDFGYDANNPFRNSNAFYYLPTDNEWVKAAYWNGTTLQTYATKAGESLTQGNGTSGTGWNYIVDNQHAIFPFGGPWNVGSGSEELNGTYDMMGNVVEWLESPWVSGDYVAGSRRGTLSGNWEDYVLKIFSSSGRSNSFPTDDSFGMGFRVASSEAVVPEPSTLIIWSLLGTLTIGVGWWRRRKRA